MTKIKPEGGVASGAAYPATWRVISAVLFTISGASLAVIIGLVLLGFAFSPPLLVRVILFFALIPCLAAALLRMAFAVDARIDGSGLTLYRRGLYQRGRTIALDQTTIKSAIPWRIPLPGPGLSILTDSGNGRRRYALQTDNPALLMDAAPIDSQPEPSPAAQVMLTYASARWAVGVNRWYHSLFKFGVFGLLPVFFAFRLHQYVMFGGLFGQYYLEGLNPYLSTLVYYWVLISIYLVLYAAFWRGLVEAASLMAAWLVPARSTTVRKWAEIIARVVYYGGIPAYIVWRSLG